MLTTIGDNGRHHTRLMSNNNEAEFNRGLWFFISEDTHKALEIENDNEFSVSFLDPDKNVSDVASGKAFLSRDLRKGE